MTDWIDAAGYRANVGIVLMRDDRQVFLGRRADGRGWQFPQGGVRRGESLEGALYRELAEETGLRPEDVEIRSRTVRWLRYRLPQRYVRHARLPLCIGQKQRWFLLRYRGTDVGFRFDTTSQPEFDRWRWADYWDPVREVIWFKRNVYTRALHELGVVAFPEGLPPYPSWWDEADRTRTPRSGARGAPA